jgi:class 3 adenylate cyclase
MVDDARSRAHTFLIADIRGYSRFTEQYGDESAARLAARFAEIVTDGVEAYDGELVEIRGDEALVVFGSARQAIRSAIDLQDQFEEEGHDGDLPLRVGIGIDSGEAVRLEDGSFRGAALNVAARLCGRAHGGQTLVSAATARLAGRLDGIEYSDRGRVRLKNIPDPIHVQEAFSERKAPAANRWTLMIFGKPARTFGWKLALAVVAIAAVTAGAVVYLTTGSSTSGGQASPPPSQPQEPTTLPANAGLDAIVPAELWKDCHLQTVAEPRALQTAVCLPESGVPDRWEISSYRNATDLAAAYAEQLRGRPGIARDKGKCNAFVWGGERAWQHGPGKPGGRVFCYFDGDDAVIVWTHQRLGQPSHRDMLAIAREGGSDHARLTHWWRPWHHLIGKAT